MEGKGTFEETCAGLRLRDRCRSGISGAPWVVRYREREPRSVSREQQAWRGLPGK